MSTFGTFLLLVTAVVGTLLVIFNPLRKLEKQLVGKTKSQIKSELDEWFERSERDQVVGKGCSIVFTFVLALLYSFMIEPVAAIAAIVREIGNQPLAYAMLVIIGLAWVEIVRAFTKKRQQPLKATVTTPEGALIQGEIVDIDEQIDLGNPTWRMFKRVVYALPTFYLWYLFLVSIRVVR